MRLLMLAAALASAGCAQTATPPPFPLAVMPPDLTPAEARIREIIAQDGVHVVHFWAPWCDNSVNELAAGWYEVIERHPEVSFTFVTVWNDGADGAATLRRYAIPERVLELTQPDAGESAVRENRRRHFLGLPMTWIPSTWVFHKNGELAFAFNYGEMEPAQLDAAIAAVQRTW
ncbi:MAG: TlpA family protein disulfide reductase [Rubricoccaceae bacterium]